MSAKSMLSCSSIHFSWDWWQLSASSFRSMVSVMSTYSVGRKSAPVRVSMWYMGHTPAAGVAEVRSKWGQLAPKVARNAA